MQPLSTSRVVSSTSRAIDASVLAARLIDHGFVHLRETHLRQDVAWETAHAVFAAAAPDDAIGSDMPHLEVVGEYALPPPDTAHRRSERAPRPAPAWPSGVAQETTATCRYQ